jgi:16S rRNA processing protein RimM
MIMEKFYNVGTIVNTQGLQGELRILPSTDFAQERFAKGTKLELFNEKGEFVQSLKVKSGRQQKNLYIVKFDGFYHINDVEKYKGFSLKISEENQTALDDGEFYYHEIIGCQVFEQDQLLGEISEILQPGANDVWVVKRQGKRDLLLPYIPPVVLSVDVKNKRVEVELMEVLDD